jgi:tRNA (mo5U34)-methyltransferase
MTRGSRDILSLQSDYDFWESAIFEQPGFPALYFIENNYAADGTNWWIPNLACATAMLRSAGFTIIQHPEDEILICGRSECFGYSSALRQSVEES